MNGVDLGRRFALWGGAWLLLFALLCVGYFLASQRVQANSAPPVVNEVSVKDVVVGLLPCALADVQLEAAAAWGGRMSDVVQVGNDLFVGMRDRVARFDATSPNNAQVVKESESLAGSVKDIAAAAGVLFVAAGEGGAVILDGDLNFLAPIDIPNAPEKPDVQRVVIQGTRLYVVLDDRSLYIFEINQPYRLSYSSRYTASMAIQSVVANEDSLFLKVGDSVITQVEMVDMRSPESPTLISTIPAINGEIALVGDYLFGLENEALNVYATADGGPPGLITSLSTRKYDWRAMVVRGEYLYLNSDDSILSVNVAIPNEPRIVSRPNMLDPHVASSAPESVSAENILVFHDGYRLDFFDVSDAATPRPLGNSAPPIATTSLAFENNRLYFTNPYQQTILDVSNPGQPQEIEAVPITQADTVAPYGRYILIAGSTPQLSVVDSQNWTIVGQQPVSAGHISQMEVSGTKLYGMGDNFSIFELADLTMPAEIGVLPLDEGEEGADAAQEMAVVGNFAYLINRAGRLTVIGLSNPTQPAIVATVTMAEITGTPVALEAINDHLLIVTTNGLLIANLNEPFAPQVIGSFSWGEQVVSAFALEGTRGYAITVDEKVLVMALGTLSDPRHINTFSFTANSALPPFAGNHAVQAVVGGGELYVANADGSISRLHLIASATRRFDLAQDSSPNAPLQFSPCAPITITLEPAQSHANGRAARIGAGDAITPTLMVTYRQLNAHQYTAFLPDLELLSPFEVEVRDEEGNAPVDASLAVTLSLRYGAPGSGALPQGVALYQWVNGKWGSVAKGINDRQNATFVATIPLQTPLRFTANAPAVVGERTLLPAIPNQMPDVTITAFEATQGTQNANSGIPLVAGRATTLRLYAETQTEFAINDFVLTLSATRNGMALDPAEITVGPRAIFPIRDRAGHNTSFETPLPLSWAEGNINLRATLAHLSGDYRGSSRQKLLYFYPVPPLDLTLIPIVVNRAGPSQEFVSDRIMQLFPLSEVRVTLHAPYFFDSPLETDTDWVNLLEQITALRYSENADPNAVYYGFIDPATNDSKIGGLGYTDVRASIGLNLGDIAAHEVGHNLGRLHAPCGNPDFVDFLYPYPDGSIGEYGYIVRTGEILAPDRYADVMSYCRPSWISDFNYSEIFFAHRQSWPGASAATPPDERVAGIPLLMVRANLQEGAPATLLPTYRFEGTPTPPAASSDYSIRLLDAGQGILATHAVTLHVAHEPGVTVQSIYALLPLPDQEIASVQLFYQDTLIATRAVGGMDNATRSTPVVAQLTLTDDTLTATWHNEMKSATRSSSGMNTATPAMIRYLPGDRYGHPQTLGVDITSEEFTMTTSQLPGGEGRIEVLLADQAPTIAGASDLPEALYLPDKPPTLWVTGPSTVGVDQPLLLFGHAFDVEDGVLEQLGWLLQGQPIAGGPVLHLTPDQLLATVGDKRGDEIVFTLEATDSGGNRSQIPIPIDME